MPHIGASLLALKEAIVKHGLSFVEVPRLRQIQNQFVGQRSGHMVEIRIALQCSHPFLRWLLQNAQRLINSAIEF